MSEKIQEEMNIIYKIIWSYIRGNPGLEFEDLLSEACLAYLESFNLYDAAKGKRSTYIYHIVRNRINNLLNLKKEYSLNNRALDSLCNNEPSPEQTLIQKEHWEELFNNFSPEAKVICNIILKNDDIYFPIDFPRKCRGIIVKELREDNWGWNVIWRTFRELKEVIS